MGNSQGVWVPSAAEERAAAGVWDKRTPEINQPGYSTYVLTLKQNSKYALLWGRRFACISTGNERLWLPSGLIQIRFDQGRPES